MTFKIDLEALLFEYAGLYEFVDTNSETVIEIKPVSLSENHDSYCQMLDFLKINLWEIGAEYISHPSSDEPGIDCFIVRQ